MAGIRSRLSILDAIKSHSDISPTGCWEWTGCTMTNGYGKMKYHAKHDWSHRWAFRSTGRDIPTGIDVCHKCDNRRCVNPDHLFLGTRLDNMRDCLAKSRIARGIKLNSRKGSDSPSAKLTWENIREIRHIKPRGEDARTMASQLGVSVDTIRKIIACITWKDQNGRVSQ